MVTDRGQAAPAGHDLVDVVAAAITGGARTVLLREKDLPSEERTVLAKALAELLAPLGGALLVAGAADLVASAGAATGIHLAADQPTSASAFRRSRIRLPAAGAAADARSGDRASNSTAGGCDNPPPGSGGDPRRQSPAGLVVGRSCHSVAELRAAQAEGVDYATFSPIWATASKPGYGPAVGLTGLVDAVAAVPDLPIFALGGVEPGRAAPCRAAGAAGVAVMGAIMRADGPASVVRSLLAELTSDEPRWPRRSALA